MFRLVACITALTLFSISTAIADPINRYKAVYLVEYGPFDLGEAHYSLEQSQDGQMTLLFNSSLKLLLLNDKRQIESDFTIDGHQLIPIEFTQDREGTGKDYKESIDFEHKRKIAKSEYSGKKAELKLEHPTFDPLNAQVQMRLDLSANETPPDRLEYQMILENKFDKFAFKSVGDEILTIDGIGYRCVKFAVDRKDQRKQTYLWFAKDLNYLPIKLEHRQKNREAASMTLIRYEEFSADGERLLAINHEQEDKGPSKVKRRYTGNRRR